MAPKKVLILCLLIFLILSVKDPFSTFNNISDLEPNPDALHYLNSVKTFIHGRGLNLSYQGRITSTNVPPLYSLSLLPLYLIFNDPRSFYFINILFSISSIFIFYLIFKRLKLNIFVFAFSLAAITTNFIIYWYPQVAMAENLLIPLFLLSIYLVLFPVTKKNLLLVILLSIAMVLTKYVAILLSLSLLLVYTIKIFKEDSNLKKPILILLSFCLGLILSTQALDYINHKTSFIIAFFNSSYFSFKYTNSNVPQFLAGLFGGEIRVAGIYPNLLPWIIGMFTIPALIFNFFDKRNQELHSYLFCSALSTFFFLCVFFIADARYFFPIVFISILSFAIFLNNLYTFFRKQEKSYINSLIIVFIFSGLILSQFNQIKNQILSNFINPNPPISYLTVQNFNSYFKENLSKKPVVVTTLTPYFVDFYSNSNYDLLPLSYLQYFTDRPESVWGKDDYSNYLNLYKKLLDEKTDVYISDYKTDPSHFYSFDYLKIKDNFNFEKVAQGCEGKCNLYKLSPP